METIRHQPRIIEFTLLVIALVFIAGLFVAPGYDWQTWHVDNGAQLRLPYTMPDFTGMPFAYFVLPHALLGVQISAAINRVLNIVVVCAVLYRYTGQQYRYLAALVFTCPTGLLLLMCNNVDWIPLSAFLVADWLAYPLLAMKPQVLAGAALIRFKRNPQVWQLIPLAIMLVLSVLIWGTWWQHVGNGLLNTPWNLAAFPLFVPIGIWLLAKAWRQDDEILAGISTPLFVPYISPGSMVAIHALILTRDRRAGVVFWFVSWWLIVFLARR